VFNQPLEEEQKAVLSTRVVKELKAEIEVTPIPAPLSFRKYKLCFEHQKPETRNQKTENRHPD